MSCPWQELRREPEPLISYYYGKNESEKYKKLLKYGMVAAAAGSVAAVLICYVGAESIVGLFLKESEASLSVYSVRVLRIFILSFLLAGLNVVPGRIFYLCGKGWIRNDDLTYQKSDRTGDQSGISDSCVWRRSYLVGTADRGELLSGVISRVISVVQKKIIFLKISIDFSL